MRDLHEPTQQPKEPNEPIVNKYNHILQIERRSHQPPTSSERKRRHYLPETFKINERTRSKGSLDRYDRYRYPVGLSISMQSMKDSERKNNKTQFSPFQPKAAHDFTIDNGKENQERKANVREDVPPPRREDTTTFSPYEQRVKGHRYESIRHQTVMPFHLNEQRKLAQNLSHLRERISKEISFKQPSRNRSPVLPIPVSPPTMLDPRPFYGSPRQTSKDIIIQEMSQENAYLNEQIVQYKQIVNRLECQLRSKDSKVLLCTENIERRMVEQRLTNEKIISQMRTEIKLLLQKNELLTRRLQQHQVESQLRERRSETAYETRQHRPYFHEVESKNNSKELYHEHQNDTKIAEEIMQMINKEYFHKIAKDKNPGRIKCSQKELKPTLLQILKRNVKLESFANCVIDMRQKVSEVKENDLKKCWKWLKSIVEQACKIKKIYEGEIRAKLRLKEDVTSQQICQAILRKL